MKIFFKNAEKVLDGIEILAPELGFTLADEVDAEQVLILMGLALMASGWSPVG